MSAALAVALAAGLGIAKPKKNQKKFKARLDGFHETPLTLSVAGRGEFDAELNEAGTALTCELEYSDLGDTQVRWLIP